MTEEAVEPDLPPWAILEYLTVAGQRFVRVVATHDDEMEAHKIIAALADAGLRVWLVDLVGSEAEGPNVSRYAGAAGAAFLHQHGIASTEAGAGDELTRRGR